MGKGPYAADLARIHNEAYGDLARGAATELLGELRRRGLASGRIADLGCGGGLLSAELARQGYDVLGIDLSGPMLDCARRAVPSGRFIRGSVHDVALPPAVAVAAVGEVVNYAFDPRAGLEALAALARRVASVLLPGGIFLLDVAGPGRGGASHRRETGDWVCLAETAESGETLERRITTFVREGNAWRRHDETHVLRLFAPDAVEAVLRSAGFDVERRPSYGPSALPRGLTAFLAGR